MNLSRPFLITYENNPILNKLKPGQAYAWAAAEIAKAPADEVARWQVLVAKVDEHENGHVSTWHGVQQVLGTLMLLSGSGSGPTPPAATAAASAQMQNQAAMVTTTIRQVDTAAQSVYHALVGPSIELTGIPGRE